MILIVDFAIKIVNKFVNLLVLSSEDELNYCF